MKESIAVDAPLIDLDELPQWILRDDEDLLVVNKPGWLVCHPSKNGPLSSLVGAVRMYTGADKLHLVARLDRETSGLVVFAKRPAVARKYQMAIQERRVKKQYLAILEGAFSGSVRVDQAIGRDRQSIVHVKNRVMEHGGGQVAVTLFSPLASGGGRSLVEVLPETGRKHQIRVHAQWMGYPVTGDKLYGPDEMLYLEFVESGWTSRHEAMLPLKRQALHCRRYEFDFPEGAEVLEAPMLPDMRNFCEGAMGRSTVF